MVHNEVFHRRAASQLQLLTTRIVPPRVAIFSEVQKLATTHAQDYQDHKGDGVSVKSTIGTHSTTARAHRESKGLL